MTTFVLPDPNVCPRCRDGQHDRCLGDPSVGAACDCEEQSHR